LRSNAPLFYGGVGQLELVPEVEAGVDEAEPVELDSLLPDDFDSVFDSDFESEPAFLSAGADSAVELLSLDELALGA
jgi:hypothetical protein